MRFYQFPCRHACKMDVDVAVQSLAAAEKAAEIIVDIMRSLREQMIREQLLKADHGAVAQPAAGGVLSAATANDRGNLTGQSTIAADGVSTDAAAQQTPERSSFVTGHTSPLLQSSYLNLSGERSASTRSPEAAVAPPRVPLAGPWPASPAATQSRRTLPAAAFSPRHRAAPIPWSSSGVVTAYDVPTVQRTPARRLQPPPLSPTAAPGAEASRSSSSITTASSQQSATIASNTKPAHTAGTETQHYALAASNHLQHFHQRQPPSLGRSSDAVTLAGDVHAQNGPPAIQSPQMVSLHKALSEVQSMTASLAAERSRSAVAAPAPALPPDESHSRAAPTMMFSPVRSGTAGATSGDASRARAGGGSWSSADAALHVTTPPVSQHDDLHTHHHGENEHLDQARAIQELMLALSKVKVAR